MLGHAAQRGWLEVAREPSFNGFQPPRQQPLAAVCPFLSKEGSAIFIFGGCRAASAAPPENPLCRRSGAER